MTLEPCPYSLRLPSGLHFSLIDPRPELVLPEDLAVGLSNIEMFPLGRFYSLAQHRVLVARRVSPEHRITALLRDSAQALEAFHPMRRVFPSAFARALPALNRAVAQRFGLPDSAPDEVLEADAAVLRQAEDWAHRRRPGRERTYPDLFFTEWRHFSAGREFMTEFRLALRAASRARHPAPMRDLFHPGADGPTFSLDVSRLRGRGKGGPVLF